jgi:hypothetical protein
MELEDENLPQVTAVEPDAAAEETRGQRWQAEVNRSDGEALALHEI